MKNQKCKEEKPQNKTNKTILEGVIVEKNKKGKKTSKQ